MVNRLIREMDDKDIALVGITEQSSLHTLQRDRNNKQKLI